MIKELTQKEYSKQVHQAMFGVEGTEDTGMVGDVKKLVKNVENQNGRIRKLEVKMAAFGAVLAVLLGSSGYGLFQILI